MATAPPKSADFLSESDIHVVQYQSRSNEYFLKPKAGFEPEFQALVVRAGKHPSVVWTRAHRESYSGNRYVAVLIVRIRPSEAQGYLQLGGKVLACKYRLTTSELGR
jgi:hypothetical protein